MERITRLSLANLKKHKLEAAALFVLVLLCMLLLGSSLGATVAVDTIFPQIVEHTQSYENCMFMQEKSYIDAYETILEQDERVESAEAIDMLYSMSTNYLDRQGKEQALYLVFITQDNNDRLQHTEIETSLTDEEIAALEHPIFMPYTMHDTMGYTEGEEFDIIVGTKKFPFTIAGFYDTFLFDQVSSGVKMIVSDADYHLLSAVIPNYVGLCYNDHQGEGNDALFYEMLDKFEERSGLDVKSGIMGLLYKGQEMTISYMVHMIMALMISMAVIIILAVAVMIRFRISSDIREQLVNIGVLEAIGYTSREITLSYVIEYLLIAAAGVLAGVLGSFMLTPVIFHAGEIITEHRGTASVAVLPIVLGAIAILAFVALVAFVRARSVRNYPPVRAFRRGQGDHRYGRDHFPLRGTKKSVHVRLALKGAAENWRQYLGLTVCIMIASVAIVFSFIMFSFFSGDMNAIAATAGMELSDLRIEMMPQADAQALADELAASPEVRKATPTAGADLLLTAADYNEPMFPICFADFSVTENIFPAAGRFPEHDNEIMITNMFARHFHVGVGDTLNIEYLKVQKPYIITGVVTSSSNGGINLYLTQAGMERVNPTYRPGTMEVYLEEGVDTAEFRYVLTEKYGRSLSDAAKERAEGGTYEDRIRAEAEQQIAEMMANYGVSHVEYAIQAGDTVISGNSDAFRIASIMNLSDILRTQLAGLSAAISIIATVFVILSAVVVMVILFVLMESTIRRQRREFGIMKGMGYTSRELMVQLAMRIMPAALTAVVCGTVLGVLATGLLTAYIGKVAVQVPLIILLDIALLAFCFGCAYFGARKIKRISVYELMTE